MEKATGAGSADRRLPARALIQSEDAKRFEEGLHCMSFDLDIATKLIAVCGSLVALFVSVPAGLKAWAEVVHVRRGHRRAEYEFAQQLARNSEDPQLQRFARELGYAVLVGDTDLQHGQRMVLLSLPEAQSKCVAYIKVRDFLIITEEPPGFGWRRPRFAKQFYRRAMFFIWVVAYALACLLAFLPWLTWSFTNPELPLSGSALAMQAMTVVSFLPLALWSLVLAVRLREAEKLMKQW